MQRGASSLKTLLTDFAKARDLWPLMGALGIGGGMGLFAIYHTAKGMLPLDDRRVSCHAHLSLPAPGVCSFKLHMSNLRNKPRVINANRQLPRF